MMTGLVALTAVLLISSCAGTVHGTTVVSWWSLGVQNCVNCINCNTLQGQGVLSPTQEDLCSSDTEPVKAIAVGARSAIIECHERFADRKWNCTTITGGSDNPFGSFLSDKRTRETAVVFAFLVAGAIQRLAQYCREGRIRECECNQATDQHTDEENNLIFEKCDQNYTWASNYIEKFTNFAYQDSDVNETESRTDFHNIEVGTKAMSTLTRNCVCHGLSGSCSVQTCYDRVTYISEVGESLIIKYDGAVKVDLVNDSLVRVGIPQADSLKPTDLAYLYDSPNFCDSQVSAGIQGTEHRECNASSTSPNSCSVLCCGRGYYDKTETELVETCVFVYCCEIKCTTRKVTRTVHRCNP